MLLGRRREIEELERLVSDAAAGHGRLCVLYGEPGIGKTRLATEAAESAAARGFTVAWGRAAETGGAPPYGPWTELLAAFGGGGPGVMALPERAALYPAVLAFLREKARKAPSLIVFDDLHTADASSLELLAFAVPRLRGERLAVLATVRDAEARAPGVAEVLSRVLREGDVLPLASLSLPDVEMAVEHRLGAPDRTLSIALFEVTQGNPLFLLEALHAVATRAGRVTPSEVRALAVSGGVAALVRERVAGAGPRLRAVLEASAVLGREIWLPLLSEVTELGALELESELADAVARGVLIRRHEQRWAFAHVLVREAFYGALAPARRAALHGAAANALHTRLADHDQADPAALAHHALGALPLGDPATAVRHALRAAEHARSRLASEQALAILERAESVCALFALPARERAEVELALGWTATEAGAVARGREQFRRVTETARVLADPRLLARAALGQGGAYVFGEVREELIAVLREALAALGERGQAEDARFRARLLARLAAALTPSQTTPDEPLALARQALDASAADSDLRTRIDVDLAAGAAFSAFASPEERIVVDERLLRNARLVEDRVLELRALTRLACDHLEHGNTAAAAASSAERARLGEALHQPRYRWQSPLLRSMQLMAEGAFERCEAEILEARRLGLEAEDSDAERCIEVHRLFLLLLAGRSDALRAQEDAALRVLGTLADAAGRQALIGSAVAARIGDEVRARGQLAAIGDAVFRWSRLWRVTAAEAALDCGARAVYEPLHATFAGERSPSVCSGPFAFVCLPPVARVDGMIAFALGRREEGSRHCERALGLALGTGARAHAAWIELALGEGLGAEGRDHLERALEIAHELSMPDVTRRARAALELAPPPLRAAPAVATPVLRESADGREWLVVRDGKELRLKSVRGIPMLRRLLDNPHREIHALELAAEGSPQGFDLGDAGPLLDAPARKAYRARLLELRSELEQAEAATDLGRTERLRAELEALTSELSRALGLGSRERRAGSPTERARIVVQRRVREAIKKIGDQDAELGRHLSWTVRTGTYCAYEPDGRKAR